MGKFILGIGVMLVVLGAVILVLERGGLHFGRLPGDISYRGKSVSFYFPITTSLLLSLLLTLILFFLGRFRR